MVDSDEEGSTKVISDSDMARIKKQTQSRDSMDEALHLRKEKDVKKNVKKKYVVEEPEEEYEPDDEDEDDDDDYDPKMDRITTVLAVIAAILIGCIVLFLVGKALGVFQFGAGKEKTEEEQIEESLQVEMIEVIGKNIDEVKQGLR